MGAWLEGVATLRVGSLQKTLYLSLAFADLALTLAASRLGLTEMNPLMSRMLTHPEQVLVFKVIGPALLAWLVPGRLLVPAIVVLGAVLGWNLKELAGFLL